MLVDVPGATPSHLIVALGKDRKAYLVNRDNLGGITAPVASASVARSSIIQAAATYRAEQGTYIAFRNHKQQRQPFCFSHYCNESAHHCQRMEREPGRGRLRLAFCHLY